MNSIIESFAVASLVGIGINLVIPRETLKMLGATCFRGKALARSGNSCRWNSPAEMVADELFEDTFLDIVAESIRENWPRMPKGYYESVAVAFDPDVPVGWVSALPREQINGAKLHLSKIGDRARGMVVSVDDRAHPAPLTNMFHLNVSYGLSGENKSEVAVRILGMGIGPDLGSLEGDITGLIRIDDEIVPRKMIFFLPQHVGGSELIPLEP